MNIKHLEYFIQAAYSASLNEAANKLYITQPTLSAALNNLEKELNLTLFDRQKRGVSLTADGLLLLIEANKVLKSYENMLDISKNNYDALEGSITLFGIPQIANSILLPTVKMSLRNYQNIKFEIVETDNTTKNINTISENEIYLGVYADNMVEEILGNVNCDSEVILKGESYLYISTENPYSKHVSIKLSDLHRFSFAMSNYTDRYAIYPYGELVNYFHKDLRYRFPNNESIMNVICENPNMLGLHSCLLKLSSSYLKKKVAALSIIDYPMPISIVMFSHTNNSIALGTIKNIIRYQCKILEHQLKEL